MQLPKLLCLSLLLASCSMPERPTMPTGKSKPVNSIATAEMLAHQAGYVIVGPERNAPDVKEQFLYNSQLPSRNTPRTPTRDQFAFIGAELVERTVIVSFTYASAEFLPTPEQRERLLQLLAVADRVEVRGRTDGRGSPAADERMALKRAEAAKRYLLDRGVPPNIIAVNYQAAGDYVADNQHTEGRNINRRVELEFYIDDFTNERVDNVAASKPDECNKSIDLSQWQEVGKPGKPEGCIR